MGAYMTALLQLTFDPIIANLEVVLMLVVFVWLFAWAHNNLGSAALAVLFAFIATFLTVFQFPILIWILVALFFFATFGKEVFDKINPYKD